MHKLSQAICTIVNMKWEEMSTQEKGKLQGHGFLVFQSRSDSEDWCGLSEEPHHPSAWC